MSSKHVLDSSDRNLLRSSAQATGRDGAAKPSHEEPCATCQHVKSAHTHGDHGGVSSCKLQSCTCTRFMFAPPEPERRLTQDDLREQAQTTGGGVIERRARVGADWEGPERKADGSLRVVPVTPGLPEGSAERKACPVFSGVLAYFPDAIAEVARLSKVGNDKHNPGEPLHWAKEKSTDHDDCIIRHQLDVAKGHKFVPDYGSANIRTRAAVAWRALAALQIEIESEST